MPIDPRSEAVQHAEHEAAMQAIKSGKGGPSRVNIIPAKPININKDRQDRATAYNEANGHSKPGTPAVADKPEIKDFFGRVIQKYEPGKPAGAPILGPGAITGAHIAQGGTHHHLDGPQAAANVTKHGNSFGNKHGNAGNVPPAPPPQNPNQAWEQNRSTNPDDIHAEAVRAQQRHYEEMRKKHPGFLPPNPMGNYTPDPVLKDARGKGMIRPDGSFNYEAMVAEGQNTGKRIPTRAEVQAANQAGGQVGVPNTSQPSDVLTPQQHAQLREFQDRNNARMAAEGSTRAPDDYTKLSPQQQLEVWRFNHERGNFPRQARPPQGQVPSQVNPNKDVNDRPIRKPESTQPIASPTPAPIPAQQPIQEKPMAEPERPYTPPKYSQYKPPVDNRPPTKREELDVDKDKNQGAMAPKPEPKPAPPKAAPSPKPIGNTKGGPNPGNIKVNKTPQGPPKSLMTPQVAKPDTEEAPVGGNYANQGGNGRTARFPRAHNLIRPNKDPIFTKPASSPVTNTIKAANTPAPVAQQPKLFPRLGQRLRGR